MLICDTTETAQAEMQAKLTASETAQAEMQAKLTASETAELDLFRAALIELYMVALVFGISEDKVNSYRNLLETPRCLRNPYWIARSLAIQIWTRWTHMYKILRAKNCTKKCNKSKITVVFLLFPPHSFFLRAETRKCKNASFYRSFSVYKK
jgi:DNA-binding CsgD family transcriptional regulator